MSTTVLERLARVTLGYKSLQNAFFYVDEDTVEAYGIEAQFLKPLFRLKDLAPGQFLQRKDPRVWLFYCLEDERDLRGTGAYRYIQSMASRIATRKKQAGGARTIRETLEAQGGGRWYAPKAAPRQHRLWLRKAVNGTYAPFVFTRPVLVDQRCNAIQPVEGLPHGSLAAMLSSTLFAYAVEVNGSAGLGAGVLEVATKHLRLYPVLDMHGLGQEEHRELQELAGKVWMNERPIDWTDANAVPGRYMRQLDQWLLERMGEVVSVDVVYRDLAEVCRARVSLGREKKGLNKRKRNESVGQVAKSVADGVRGFLELKRFPEDFVGTEEGETIEVIIERGRLQRIEMHRLMDLAELRLIGTDGVAMYGEMVPWSVAEVIVRACLIGRREFSVRLDANAADVALRGFREWFGEIERRLSGAVADSALGTGYEEQLRGEVFKLLGVDPVAGQAILPAVVDVYEE